MHMILFLKNKKKYFAKKIYLYIFINLYWFYFWKKKIAKKFTYIFLLIYTLNAPKIKGLYMTKKISIKRKIKETTIIKEHLYLFFF